MNSEFDLEHIFQYHTPTDEQITQYQTIREAAKTFAQVILDNSPACPDQSVAIRNIREAVMVANAAIALSGRIYK